MAAADGRLDRCSRSPSARAGWRAIAVVVVTPLLYGDVGGVVAVLLFLARWAVAGLLLLLAVALLLHYAPERRSPLHWVTFGAVLIMAGWLVMSLGFGLYLREIADYNSIFGGLATVVVLIAYLYAARPSCSSAASRSTRWSGASPRRAGPRRASRRRSCPCAGRR